MASAMAPHLRQVLDWRLGRGSDGRVILTLGMFTAVYLLGTCLTRDANWLLQLWVGRRFVQAIMLTSLVVKQL